MTMRHKLTNGERSDVHLSIWFQAEQLGRLLLRLAEEVQTIPPASLASRWRLLPSDLEVVTLLSRLRSSLKPSLADAHRQALTGLIGRQGHLTLPRFLVRLHFEDSLRLQREGGAPEAIKFLTQLLLAVPATAAGGAATSCRCRGAAARARDSLPPTGDSTASSPNSQAEYTFPKQHRRQASLVLGQTLQDLLLPNRSPPGIRAGKSSACTQILDQSELATLLEDVLKVVKTIGLCGFCPDLFFGALLRPSSRGDGADELANNGKVVIFPTEGVMRFIADLAASVQLLYAQDILECQRRRDKRLLVAASAVVSSAAISGVAGQRVKQAGGRGTAGLSLSSKSKVPGRGSGLSLAAARSGSSTSARVQVTAIPGDKISSGVVPVGLVPLSRSSPDDLVEPRLLCEQQTDVFLSRGGRVQEAVLNWFTSCVETYHENLLSGSCGKPEGGRVDLDELVVVREQKNSLDTRDPWERKDCDEPLDSGRLFSTAVLIDFVQKVLLASPAVLRLPGSVEKLAVHLAQESCLLSSPVLQSIIEAIARIAALEQLSFERGAAGASKVQGRASTLDSNTHKIFISAAAICRISFLQSLSANRSVSGVSRGAAPQEEKTGLGGGGGGQTTAYNCAHLLASGIDLLEAQARRALQTSYREGGRTTGMLVDSVEVMVALILCFCFTISHSLVCSLFPACSPCASYPSVASSSMLLDSAFPPVMAWKETSSYCSDQHLLAGAPPSIHFHWWVIFATALRTTTPLAAAPALWT